jgi:hypothetical protein
MSDINVIVNDEIVNIDVIDEPVLVNVVNSPGVPGAPGQGVPVGGTTGQVLAKNSNTNYDTEWVDVSGGAWGTITGTLSNQTDLQTALNAKFDDPTGTTSQYLRGDGSLATFPSLTGFVPYTGATGDVDLGTHTILAQNATIASSGSGDTATITHSSGSGIGLNITKGGNGEGLYINKTGGSGNAATIIGTINSTSFVKSGGTSSQFLKADGTVDSSVYVPTSTTLTINGVSYDLSANRSWTVAGGISGSGASGQVAYWDGTTSQAGSNNLFWDAANGRLGIGTNAPAYDIELQRNKNSGTIHRITNTNNNASAYAAFELTTTSFASMFKHPTARTYKFILGDDLGFYNSTAGDISILNDFATGNIKFGAGGSSTAQMTLHNTGNLLLGSTTNSGERLQVTGDVRIVGSGATSGTTALRVQNSAAANLFSVRNDGLVSITPLELTGSQIANALSINQTWNTTENVALIYGKITDTTSASGSSLLRLDVGNTQRFTISKTGAIKFGGVLNAVAGIASSNPSNGAQLANATAFGLYSVGGTYIGHEYFFTSATLTRTATSGTNGSLITNMTFNPTSGTADYNVITIGNIINQTGGANGITRGLYVNPTLTAAADWRSIEWSNNSGWGLYGVGTANNYLGGNLLLGSTTNSGERLQVTGTMKVTGASSFGGAISINIPSVTAIRENIVTATISDSATDKFIIANGTSNNGQFVPNFAGYVDTSSTTWSLGFSGLLSAATDSSDSSNFGVLRYNTLRTSSSTDPLNGTFTAVSNRKLVTFENGSVPYAIFYPTGNLLLQNGGTFSDVASSRLTINSTTQGFLPPRMTTTQKNAISSPAAGLVVYDTTLNKLCVYTTAWETITSI